MWRELLGLDKKSTNLVELIVPKRSFSDVILPPETRQQLYEALTHIGSRGAAPHLARPRVQLRGPSGHG